MKYDITGYARGPRGQHVTVTWEGVEMGTEPSEQQIVKNEMRRKLIDSFPGFFGCDPEHIEVHVDEHVPEIGGDDPSASHQEHVRSHFHDPEEGEDA